MGTERSMGTEISRTHEKVYVRTGMSFQGPSSPISLTSAATSSAQVHVRDTETGMGREQVAALRPRDSPATRAPALRRDTRTGGSASAVLRTPEGARTSGPLTFSQHGRRAPVDTLAARMHAGSTRSVCPACALAYAPPAVVTARGNNVAVAGGHDVWALGVLTFEALSQRRAFSSGEHIIACAAGSRRYPWHDCSAPTWRQSPLRPLVLGCLTPCERARPTAADVLDRRRRARPPPTCSTASRASRRHRFLLPPPRRRRSPRPPQTPRPRRLWPLGVRNCNRSAHSPAFLAGLLRRGAARLRRAPPRA